MGLNLFEMVLGVVPTSNGQKSERACPLDPALTDTEQIWIFVGRRPPIFI